MSRLYGGRRQELKAAPHVERKVLAWLSQRELFECSDNLDIRIRLEDRD
jgi:hypothetical protein